KTIDAAAREFDRFLYLLRQALSKTAPDDCHAPPYGTKGKLHMRRPAWFHSKWLAQRFWPSAFFPFPRGRRIYRREKLWIAVNCSEGAASLFPALLYDQKTCFTSLHKS